MHALASSMLTLAAIGALCLPAAASAQSTAQSSTKVPVFTCEHANAPSDTYIGWADKQTGAFLFRCLVFADRTGVAFQMTYRSPQAGDRSSASVIGGGWGTDFDDVAHGGSSGRVVIRNGSDGSVDTYGARRRGSPLLVSGNSAEQRERRAEACEYVEHEELGGLRRVDCGRNIQHFDESGRLIRYFTHAFRQIFELNWGDGSGRTVTGDRWVLSVMGETPAGKTIFTAFRTRPDRTTVTDQDDRTVIFAFDESGRLASARSSAGEIYRFDYGTRGGLVAVTFPDGGVQTMTYDPTGRIAEIAARRGATARFLYRSGRTEVIERAADGTSGRTVVKFR